MTDSVDRAERFQPMRPTALIGWIGALALVGAVFSGLAGAWTAAVVLAAIAVAAAATLVAFLRLDRRTAPDLGFSEAETLLIRAADGHTAAVQVIRGLRPGTSLRDAYLVARDLQ